MIYLDYNATTPLDPRVLEAMLPYFSDTFGNPASTQHAYGARAADAVARARNTLSDVLACDTREIVFTSGATEACNTAIKGVFDAYQRKGRHIVLPRTEHKAVLDCVTHLGSKGADVTYVDVDASGRVDPDAIEQAIRQDTVLVCLMWANNETGVIQPMAEIGRICERKGTLLFSDATQAVGKIPVDPRSAGVQLLALSAHKCYGPKGAGALYVSQRSPRIKLEPRLHGGGHEGGLRSGTLNVPGIVGLSMAFELAQASMTGENSRMRHLRDRIEHALSSIDGAAVNGDIIHRLSHVSNIRFAQIDANAVMERLKNELAIATGSACTSADPEPSYVLQAMGLSRNEARASLRISVGRMTTEDEIDRAIQHLKHAISEQR